MATEKNCRKPLFCSDRSRIESSRESPNCLHLSSPWGFNPSFSAFRYFPPSIVLHIASYLLRPLVYTSNNPSITSIAHKIPLSGNSFSRGSPTNLYFNPLHNIELLWSVFPPQYASIILSRPRLYRFAILQSHWRFSRWDNTSSGGENPQWWRGTHAISFFEVEVEVVIDTVWDAVVINLVSHLVFKVKLGGQCCMEEEDILKVTNHTAE